MRDNLRLPIDVVGKYMEQTPVDVRGLGEALGLNIVEAVLSDNISGKIERDWFGGYDITVNRRHSETRKRFTIAHEIAHYILHRDEIGDGIVDDGLYRDKRLSSSIERQANQYAADILMPWSTVINDPDFRAGNIRALASKFGVSPAVAEIRMKELELFI